jgi:hypothetical protein
MSILRCECEEGIMLDEAFGMGAIHIKVFGSFHGFDELDWIIEND